MDIEFIIPTYNRPNGLLTIIGSILQQSAPNWKIHVVADGPYEGYEKVKSFFSENEKIRFSELEGPHKDWGHTAREYGLQQATSEWVVMTGDDNYYTPPFVERFSDAIRGYPKAKFVFCDMIHNCEQTHTPSYRYFDSKIAYQPGYIDIGNFASKTEFSKTIPLNKTSYVADFEFVNSYIRKYCNEDGNVIKISKALYVHN